MRALITISRERKEGEGVAERVKEAKAVTGDFKTLLESTTRFPKAGERNEPVEEFVDLIYAFWTANGFRAEYSEWIIEVSPTLPASHTFYLC
jgi:hypothetical protein